MHKLLLIILFFSNSSLASPLAGGGAELLNSKAYSIKGVSTIFQSTAVYDANGAESALEEGDEFRLIDFDLEVGYGLSRKVEVAALVRFRQASSTRKEVQVTNSGIESLGVLAKYGFSPIGNTRYALGVHYRQTLYTNANYDTSVQVPANDLVLGDSGSEYGVNLYITHNALPWKFDLTAGYLSPANQLSEEIIYNFESMFKTGGLGVMLGIDGIYSLKSDPLSETPLTRPIQATGASNFFNSINREKFAPYFGVQYAFSSALVSLKAQTVVSGSSTDKGHSVGLGIGWGSEGVTPEAIRVESFKEYIVDGSVLKVSARGNFLRVDQGLSTDVEKGMKFDIYQTDYFGGNVLVASGVAYEVGADWSIIKLVKKFKEIEIKPGFAARGY